MDNVKPTELRLGNLIKTVMPPAYIVPGLLKAPIAEDVVVGRAFRAIEEVSGIKKKDFTAKDRKHELVICRVAFCQIVREHTFMTITKIGVHIGNKNYATVLYLLKKHSDWMQVDRLYRDFYNSVVIRFVELDV